MNNRNAILIIDPQFDFCNPNGNLYVNGADYDMERLADWIKSNKNKIDHIVISLDNHTVNDISHPSFWHDLHGNPPDPFTPISLKDIQTGKWTPRHFKQEAYNYIEALEKQGEFTHFIWPYHCLTGSKGAAIDDNIMDALIDWSFDDKTYQVVTKGSYPLTEHFGIFRANIPAKDISETQLNQDLIDNLVKYDNVFLAGEAKSHCVANSLKQVMEHAPKLAQKFIILEDCMSDVPGLAHLGTPVYENARKLAIRFMKSTDISL